MVRKRVQRTKKYQPLDTLTTPATDLDQRERNRLELGEILEAARHAVLTSRQDRIIELWMRGWSVPEIGAELKLPVTRVSDEKYKALRKLEHQLSHPDHAVHRSADLVAHRGEELALGAVGLAGGYGKLVGAGGGLFERKVRLGHRRVQRGVPNGDGRHRDREADSSGTYPSTYWCRSSSASRW